MSNLLAETLEVLNKNDKTENDVLWVGNDEEYISWKKFKKFATKDYDSGFGTQEVSECLYIVGVNWWLERHEYDGSEWWEYKRLPEKPEIVARKNIIWS